MKIWSYFLAFLTISFFAQQAAAAIKKSTPTNDEGNFIVAKINNKAITNSELIDRYRFVISMSKINIALEEEKKLLLDQVIDKMIDEELIRQEASKLKIEATPDEIRDAVEIIALRQKKNATQFKFFFINNNLSFDNYLKQVESDILWSKIVSEVMKSRIKVTEAEVKEFFEQRKFNTSIKKFSISEILISDAGNSSKKNLHLASKLVAELRQGADFNNIVRQFSSSISAENNGEIGWVSNSDIDIKIYTAISKLNKGGYSDPILLSDGYHIFKLLDVKTESKIADQDMSAARNAIFSHKLQSVAKGYLMDLRKKAFVEVKLSAN
jgi:peptidyl-prolyl cis-trans isomerase SurA